MRNGRSEHWMRSINFTQAIEGEARLRNAVYIYVQGVQGRRENGVQRGQIRKYLRATPHAAVDNAILVLIDGGNIRAKGCYFFADHAPWGQANG